MEFLSARQQQEFYGPDLDGRVRAIACELDLWSMWQYQKRMFCTAVLRTPAEQAAIYPNNPAKPSPHLDRPCRALDFRRIHFTAEELQALTAYFAHYWGRWHYKETGNPAAILLVDDRGPASPHLHLACFDVVDV